MYFNSEMLSCFGFILNIFYLIKVQNVIQSWLVYKNIMNPPYYSSIVFWLSQRRKKIFSQKIFILLEKFAVPIALRNRPVPNSKNGSLGLVPTSIIDVWDYICSIWYNNDNNIILDLDYCIWHLTSVSSVPWEVWNLRCGGISGFTGFSL